MIPRESIETAYCFFHQKERVYAHSTMEWQCDDIEYAVSSYVESMNPQLYAEIASGRKGFLCSHDTFHADLLLALDKLENMMQQV